MQTTLLGLAIAIILALVSALVAPLIVDWNRYRSAFEEEASRLVGVPVRVNGTIDARILPSPHIKLRHVEVGAPGGQPQARAEMIELEVGLGPLLRGEVRATELRLVAPQISLALDRSGAVKWPAPSAAFRPDALTISRLAVENGRIVLADEGSGSRFVLQKVSFNGDVRSFIGPFQGEGSFAANDELYAYRLSGGRFDAAAGLKLSLGVDPSNRPLTSELEGTLSFDGGVPEFEGRLTLARPVGAALARGERVMNDPWQLGGKIRLVPAGASLQDLVFQYGPNERAVNFTGKAQVTFGEHPRLDGTVSARQVDVDRALAAPDVTHRPPFVMVKSFCEAFAADVKPPLPIVIGIGVDAVTVGGTAIQSLRGTARFENGEWHFDDFAFRAPGFTEMNLSGHLQSGPQGLALSGPAKLESADASALMAWLEGRTEPPGLGKSLTARGEVTITSDRFALNRLSAVLGQERVEGRLAYAWATAEHPPTIDAELRAATLNVDALWDFAKASMPNGALEVPHRVALILDVEKATLGGVDARMVNARVKLDAGILHVDRLTIGDLGEAALDISGRIDELSSQPRGRLAINLEAGTLAGLADVLGRAAPKIADRVRAFAERLATAKIKAVLTLDRAAASGTTVKLDLSGLVGAIRLALNGEATGESNHPGAAVVSISSRLDADDGGALLRLLDLDRVLAVDQLPGQMTISANGPLDGAVHVNGLAAAGGFSAVVDGMLHLQGEEAPTGTLGLKAFASDLTPLHQMMIGQPGASVPISASATIALSGVNLSLADLSVSAGKSALHGRLAIKLANPLGIDGDIEADNVDTASVLAMLLGFPSAAPGSGGAWSAEPIGHGAFAAVNGAVKFKLDRAVLTPTFVAHDVTGLVRLQPSAIALSDLEANFAGGHLTGELMARHDPRGVVMSGRTELAGANTAAILASKNAVDGQATVKLQAEGTGLSPEGLIRSLHGSGSIELGEAYFSGLDTSAFAAAIQAADRSDSIEAPKIQTVVGAAVEDGRLPVAPASAKATIAAGKLLLTSATLRARDGAALTLDGVLDFNKAVIDAQLTLSKEPAASDLIPTRPEFAITVKGPFAAPERKLEVSRLVAWLTLRAAERQTRRLESLEANRREEVLGTIVRAPSPVIRFIPMGTALETADRSTASAPAAPGAAAFDRLRPEAAAAYPSTAATATLPSSNAIKPIVPGADKPTITSGTAQPLQTPVRAPLDLLFRSQN